VEQNVDILCALKVQIRTELEHRDPREITKTGVDASVAADFHTSAETVREIRKTYEATGEVAYWKSETRGAGADSYPTKQKLSFVQQLRLASHIDTQHAAGRRVTNKTCINFLASTYNITISRSTMAAYLSRLGLSWRKVKPKKRTLGSYRKDAIRDFLIGYDKHYRDPNVIFVYTDESYIHAGHGVANSYCNEHSEVIGSNSKGRRLVILHAITENGPLAELDEQGVPVDDLDWNGDTPHPVERPDGKLTCETLWMASSSKGDYHDNMNGEMFLQWVENKLIKTFQKLYPHKKMVLVADNAAYHHVRVIGSLSGLSKKKIVELMKEHKVEYLDVPWSDNLSAFVDHADDGAEFIQDRGEYMRIMLDRDDNINIDTMGETASNRRPYIPTVDQLKTSFVTYLAENHPNLLECKVEAKLREHDYEVLWTPPYCPDAQPIELFWASGKNHAAGLVFDKRKMKETIEHLREGWHGNIHHFEPGDESKFLNGDYTRPRKNKVDCKKLVATAVKYMNTKFMNIVDGLEGEIGNLTIDPAYVADGTGIPIDLLVVDLTRVDDSEDIDIEDFDMEEEEEEEGVI
jgi:transposase